MGPGLPDSTTTVRIAGRDMPTTGAVRPVIDPATEEPWAEVRLAGLAEADAAVDAARRAAPALAATPVVRRARALRDLADALEARAPGLAITLTRQNGCPAAQSEKLQVHSAVALLRACADLAESFAFEEPRVGLRGGRTLVQRVPVGVGAGIVPWNVPLFLACMKLGPALAAGCPLILKPSPETALDGFVLGELAASLDLPPGAVSVLPADRDVGIHLVAHPKVDKVSFTGSTAAGRAVARACAERFARVTLELGGKSAAVVLDDVDLDAVREQLFLATLQNNGQVCGAQTRVLLPRHRAGELRDWLVASFAGLRVGDPSDHETDVGPLVSAVQRDRVLGHLERARADGARCLVGGGAPEGRDRGWFVAPTLVDGVDNQAAIAREEVFGPVITLLEYETLDEAVAIANDSPYGLSGSVWTSDPERGVAVARRLRTGTVGLNTKRILDWGSPFGGMRASGVGRELGPEGLSAWLELRTVLIPEEAP